MEDENERRKWNMKCYSDLWNIFLIMIAMIDQTTLMFMFLLTYWKNDSSLYCFVDNLVKCYLSYMVSNEWILEKRTWSGIQNWNKIKMIMSKSIQHLLSILISVSVAIIVMVHLTNPYSIHIFAKYHWHLYNQVKLFSKLLFYFLLLFVKMERVNRNKPLTSEMKGKLITLYQSNASYSEIAIKLGINVNILQFWIKFSSGTVAFFS